MFENFTDRGIEAQRKVMIFHLDLKAHVLGWFCCQRKASQSWDMLVVSYAQFPGEGLS